MAVCVAVIAKEVRTGGGPDPLRSPAAARGGRESGQRTPGGPARPPPSFHPAGLRKDAPQGLPAPRGPASAAAEGRPWAPPAWTPGAPPAPRPAVLVPRGVLLPSPAAHLSPSRSPAPSRPADGLSPRSIRGAALGTERARSLPRSSPAAPHCLRMRPF